MRFVFCFSYDTPNVQESFAGYREIRTERNLGALNREKTVPKIPRDVDVFLVKCSPKQNADAKIFDLVSALKKSRMRL